MKMMPFCRRRLCFCCLIVAGMLSGAATTARCAPLEGKEKEAILDRAEQAWSTARKNMQSARAKGSYRVEKDGKPFTDANVAIELDGKKFFLTIDDKLIQPALPKFTKRTAVSDGNSITITQFAPQYRPHGCETEVYGAGYPEFVDATKGIRVNLLDLGVELVDVALARTRFDLQVIALDNSQYRVAYDLSKHTAMQFDVEPKLSYNIVRSQVSSPEIKYVETKVVDWKQAGENWFINGIDETEERDGKVEMHRVLHYDEVELNPRLDASKFTVDALDPTPGSRVIDRRPGANPAVRKLPKADAKDPK